MQMHRDVLSIRNITLDEFYVSANATTALEKYNTLRGMDIHTPTHTAALLEDRDCIEQSKLIIVLSKVRILYDLA